MAGAKVRARERERQKNVPYGTHHNSKYVSYPGSSRPRESGREEENENERK